MSTLANMTNARLCNLTLCFVILLACGVGCDSSPAIDAQQSNFQSLSPEELTKIAMEEVKEFKFCVSEGAGSDMLQPIANRLGQIVESLSASSADNKSAETLKASCDRLADAVANETAPKKLIQISLEIGKNLKSLTN